MAEKTSELQYNFLSPEVHLMLGKRSTAGSVLSAIIIYSIFVPSTTVFSQDLVASEEIGGGGSSVFVFRESRKKAQVKAAAGGGVADRAGRGGGSRRRIDSRKGSGWPTR